ncbi:MAG: cation transporter, partial [Patescibacteria group bacterium]
MNTKKTFKIKGMHCASCASIIERTIKKIDGVEDIAVNNGTENAKISFDENKTTLEDFNKKLEPIGYTFVKPMTASEMGMSENEHA